MSKSRQLDEADAISTILTKTQRLLKIEAQKDDSAFHKAQLLLSEYMAMLTETQSDNDRLRRLLGRYADSPPGRKAVPASLTIATLQKRVEALNTALATLRGALERIEACETEAARGKPGEIAAHALRSVDRPRKGATGKRKSAAAGKIGRSSSATGQPR